MLQAIAWFFGNPFRKTNFSIAIFLLKLALQIFRHRKNELQTFQISNTFEHLIWAQTFTSNLTNIINKHISKSP